MALLSSREAADGAHWDRERGKLGPGGDHREIGIARTRVAYESPCRPAQERCAFLYHTWINRIIYIGVDKRATGGARVQRATDCTSGESAIDKYGKRYEQQRRCPQYSSLV